MILLAASVASWPYCRLLLTAYCFCLFSDPVQGFRRLNMLVAGLAPVNTPPPDPVAPRQEQVRS